MGVSCSSVQPSAPQFQFLSGEGFVSVFDGTGNIAVANVSNPRPLWFDYEDSTISCGWAYTAEVIESLSGDGKTFEFVIPTFQPPKMAVPPGRYLVFTKRDPHLASFSAFEECIRRMDYYTSFETEMMFPVVPGTGDRKVRGPTQEDNILDILGPPCGIDEGGSVYCVDDVREGIRKIREE
jgi:hypothetical protein